MPTASDRRSFASTAAQPFTTSEWVRLSGLYGFIGLLHVVGWGLYLGYVRQYPALVGLGLTAYLFGLRHAFDADHIAAIDNTVRSVLARRRSPLSIGFFFSLGHSTVVFGVAVLLACTASAFTQYPRIEHIGGVFGASVSGIFLWVIGILNLLVLLDLLQIWGRARHGNHSHDDLEAMLARRGLINRLLGQRYLQGIKYGWQMYPLGFLFGLGLDTATEVSLLAMTAGAASGSLPWPAVLSLPILFAAGMTLLDTTDSVLMTKAYRWAFINPVRKVFYNATTTLLSVVVALVIGTIELLQVLVGTLGLKGGIFSTIADLNFGDAGFVIVGLFMVAWLASLSLWKFGRPGRDYPTAPSTGDGSFSEP